VAALGPAGSPPGARAVGWGSTAGLLPWRQLLKRPDAAVGIAEGDERAPRLHVEVAGLHAVRDELLPGGLHIGHHVSHALLPARWHLRDPGAQHDGACRPTRAGSCANRSASLTW
jgi:hypothetical protein